MARIFWLDDDRVLREPSAQRMREAGHEVELFETEEELVSYLLAPEKPDLLIQDLLRPSSVAQIPQGKPRRMAESALCSGWAFYEDVMRPHFPQIPVLIVSMDANTEKNRIRADDFNLRLAYKNEFTKVSWEKIINEVLNAQIFEFKSKLILPNQIRIDFTQVTDRLIEHIAKIPSDLHNISWSAFEELVSELLAKSGYEVCHTPLTRDGGVDIWAIRRDDFAETLFAIDTKKYAPNRVIGPEPVRAIYGVTQINRASIGMIITTARFGPEARSIEAQYRHQLSLKDFDYVSNWVKKVSESI